MKCPKCGYHRQTRDNAFVPATECPSCGVVYSKHENMTPSNPGRSVAPVAPSLRPSPVDADSLKKARDRVEERLRKRLASNEKDDRHAQTLKLARRFTDDELRKRQEKRQEAQSQDDEPQTLIPLEEESPEAVAGEQTAGTVEVAQMTDLEADQSAGDEITAETNTDEDSLEELESSATADAQEAVETENANPSDAEEAAETEMIYEAAPVPGKSPDSDVSVETVILTSTLPGPTVRNPAAAFDSTPLDVDDSPNHKEDMPQEAAAMEEDLMPDTPEAEAVSQAPAFQSMVEGGRGQLRMLSAVAWLILGAGIIGAILSWTTISDVEAGMRIPVPDSVNTLSLGLLLGFAYLATGVLGFAFFWVSSTISQQLKDIRGLLMLHSCGHTSLDRDDEVQEDIENHRPAEA